MGAVKYGNEIGEERDDGEGRGKGGGKWQERGERGEEGRGNGNCGNLEIRMQEFHMMILLISGRRIALVPLSRRDGVDVDDVDDINMDGNEDNNKEIGSLDNEGVLLDVRGVTVNPVVAVVSAG